MSYDLSFDKKSAMLLGVCGIIIVALLVAAGFLLGMDHSRQATQAELPLYANPQLISAPPSGKSTPPAKTLSSTAAPASPDPAPSPVTKVDTTPVPPKETMETSKAAFTLQFGAFKETANAESLIKKLKEGGVTATVFIAQDNAGRTWYAVRSGEYATMPEASASADSLRSTTQQPILVRPAHRL